jgi:hypothetical protein
MLAGVSSGSETGVLGEVESGEQPAVTCNTPPASISAGTPLISERLLMHLASIARSGRLGPLPIRLPNCLRSVACTRQLTLPKGDERPHVRQPRDM